MDRIFLCSFGNSSYLSSLSRLRAQAEETGWFYRVECNTEKIYLPFSGKRLRIY